MTDMPFTCDDFEARLAAHLEHDLPREQGDAMEAHAAACSACAAIVAEIAAIQHEAAGLPELVPGRDLWQGIAARIDAPVIPIGSGTVARTAGLQRVTKRRWWAHPALAAAALVGVTAGVTWYMTKESIERPAAPATIAQAPTAGAEGSMVIADSPAAGAAHDGNDAAGAPAAAGSSGRSGGPLVGSGQQLAAGGQRAAAGAMTGGRSSTTASAAGVQLAAYRPGETAVLDSLYYREIIRLRRLVNERSTQLDSSTVAVIGRNMLVIDRAIQECREALAADPASKFLNQQLNQALETKIELLRTAAMMPVGS